MNLISERIPKYVLCNFAKKILDNMTFPNTKSSVTKGPNVKSPHEIKVKNLKQTTSAHSNSTTEVTLLVVALAVAKELGDQATPTGVWLGALSLEENT